jgi:hypothetical protein
MTRMRIEGEVVRWLWTTHRINATNLEGERVNLDALASDRLALFSVNH